MKLHRISMGQRAISLFLAASVLLTSCASTTMIRSEPGDAKVYLNGEPVGTTPYTHTDTKIVGTTTMVRLEKEGYETLNTSFSRDEEADIGAIIGGFLFLFPFLWTMKYKPSHTYELEPVGGDELTPAEIQMNLEIRSKADRLREFKKLLDEGVITKEEFEKEKKKILEEEEK